MIRIATVALLALLAACASSSSSPSGKGDEGKPAARKGNPLGVGYPDPAAVLDEIWERMEERDFEGLCGLLAGPGRNGRAVPLVPGKNVPPLPEDSSGVWLPERFLGPTRDMMKQPWVSEIHYGKPRVVTNDPVFYAVPVIVEIDYERIPEQERAMLVKVAQKQHSALDWPELVAQGKAKTKRMLTGEEPAPELGFVFIERWRFYADVPPAR